MEEYSLTDEATVSRISDTCPRTLSAYFLCLHESNSDGFVTFSRDDIVNNRVRSWTKFKNDIRTLAGIYVLNFKDNGDQIEVQLILEDS